MIMDEPFRGLDAMTRQLMQEFYLRLCEEEERTNVFVTSELEEAIILADSLVVLSNRPTTVREVVQIDLPRPRNLDMLSSPEAYDYKRHAMEMLHEEALKSFSGTESEKLHATRLIILVVVLNYSALLWNKLWMTGDFSYIGRPLSLLPSVVR